jgi:FKBP-type peptidyl-prolyl cis-trans isomerase SlpA
LLQYRNLIPAPKEKSTVIEEGSAVSIEYTLTLDDGETADTNVGGEALVYSQGQQEILPALEEALIGLEVGDTKKVVLTAEEGYGLVDPDGFQDVEPDLVPEDAQTVGTMLVASDPEGNQQPIRVHEVGEDKIVLDFNHPLAGQALNFDIKITGIE